MTALSLFEVETLSIVPSIQQDDSLSQKFMWISNGLRGINIHMILTIAPAQEVEFNQEVHECSQITMVDGSIHLVPVQYRTLLDKINHWRL